MQRVEVALADRAGEFRLGAQHRRGDRLSHPLRQRRLSAFLQPQREIAGGGIGMVRHDRRGQVRARDEAAEVERPARLRARARQAAPAERLHADDGADDVTVDVEIARLHPAGDVRDRFVEARVQAEGEAVAGGVDPVDQPIQLRAAEADDVQDRAEHLALQLGNVGQFDDRRRDERAVRGIADERELFDAVAAGPHLCDVLVDIVLRLCGDDRADIGRQGVGAADRQLMQRALDHRERAVGDLLLQAQDAQRRTALPCAVEGGGDDVRHHLFGERGRIDDHRILPAGFGDERDRRSVGQQALGQLLLDQPGDLGRSGEHHRHRLGRGDQRGADRTVTGDEL